MLPEQKLQLVRAVWLEPLPSRPGLGSRAALVWDLGQVPRTAPSLSFLLCEMGMVVVATSWDYLGAFLHSAWQKVGAQLAEAISSVIVNK